MSARRDPGVLLMRAMRRDAVASSCAVTLEPMRATPWASATFVGARHIWQVDSEAGDLNGWLAGLPEADFALPGHLLADLSICRDGATVTIEALILEAA